MSVSRNKIEKNLQRIRQEISAACDRSRRGVQSVRVIAVTKSIEMDEIKSLLDLGLTDFGESYVQQLIDRSAEVNDYIQRRRTALAGPVQWHMIGHLQRNKVKAVLDTGIGMIHSVDSLRLAEEINVRAQKMNIVADVLMEVNCSEESQKFGVAVGASVHLAELMTTLKNLRLVGLMTMAPRVSNPERARPTFVRLRELYEEIRHEGIVGPEFCHMSMGMSQDYAIAVEEGATLLRIGSALFE